MEKRGARMEGATPRREGELQEGGKPARTVICSGEEVGVEERGAWRELGVEQASNALPGRSQCSFQVSVRQAVQAASCSYPGSMYGIGLSCE